MSKTPSLTLADLRAASVDLILSKIAPGQRVWMRVKGTSMFPALRPGDEVEVEIIRQDRLRFSDLVVLDTVAAGLVIHRLFGLRRHGQCSFLTKGDASPRFDPPWPDARFLGRVRSVRRDGVSRPCRRSWLLLGALRSLLVGCRAALARGARRAQR